MSAYDFESAETKFAMAATAEAAMFAKHIQQRMVSPALTKGDRSPVTVADFAVQALVAKRLQDQFPAAVLVGEEDATALRKPEEDHTLDQITTFLQEKFTEVTLPQTCEWIDRGGADPTETFWTLDPIDGTKGFLRGDQYVVAFALLVAGEVEIGVLGCSQLKPDGTKAGEGEFGSLVVAVRGHGAKVAPLNDLTQLSDIKASEISTGAEIRLLGSYESGHTNHESMDHFRSRLGIERDVVRMDSQAKYALVAFGQGELLVRFLSPDRPNYREKIWDHAAGMLIVHEAGGSATDLDGKALDFHQGRALSNNRGVLVSNGKVHEAAVSAVQELGL